METLIKTLQTALEMERRARELYLDAADRVRDVVVRSVLVALADDEQAHGRAIEHYYQVLERTKSWPSSDTKYRDIEPPEAVKRLVDGTAGSIEPDVEFAGVYEKAYELEVLSRDFYRSQADAAQDINVREFFGFLARLEQAHVDALQVIVESARGA